MKRDASRPYALVLAGLVVLVTAAPVFADAGPAIPGTRRVTASHRVVAREAFPDHLFILCDGGWGASSGAKFVAIEPGRPLLIEFRDPNNRHAITLVVVPRTDAPPGSAADVAVAVFDRRISTATTHQFSGRDSAMAWSGNRVTIDYTLRRNGAGDRLEVVRTSPDETFACCCAAPLFASLAAVSGGLYVVFRWLRPARTPSPMPRPPE